MIRSKLLNNLSWLFFDKVVRLAGGLIIGVWVARYLGPNDFGVLSYSLAYTAIFTLFVNLGLNQIVIRELVKKEKLTKYILGTAFGLKLIGSVVAIVGIYASLFFVETDEITKSVIFVLSAGFVLQSLDVVDYFYQSQILSKYVVFARNSAFVISSALKMVLIVKEYSVIYFAAASTFDVALAGLFLILIYKKTGHKIREWKFSTKIAADILRSSWPLALSVFLVSVHMKIDQVMIGSMLDSEQVGLYGVAVKLAEFWIFVPTILVSTFLPYFVNLKEKNNESYHCRLMQLYSFMFWMGVFVGIATIIFGENVIVLLFGEVYKGAYAALVFNIWSGLFVSQALVRGIWLISENLQKYRLYNNIIAVVLNVTINIWLIPKLGIAGAAIATLATQALGTWVFSFLWQPLRNSTWIMIKSVNPVYLIKMGDLTATRRE